MSVTSNSYAWVAWMLGTAFALGFILGAALL